MGRFNTYIAIAGLTLITTFLWLSFILFVAS